MVVIGIDDIWAEDEKTTSDRIILEMATRAEHFQPAVIVDELLAEIGGGIGLAPVEVATAISKQTSEWTSTVSCNRRRTGDMGEARQATRREFSPRHGPIYVGCEAPRHFLAEAGQKASYA